MSETGWQEREDDVQNHGQPALAPEIRRIADELLEMAECLPLSAQIRRERRTSLAGSFSQQSLAALAKSIYSSRRRRDRLFPSGLFADPAWDMLLDLFMHQAKGRRVSVTSLCIASSVPNTTALRWLGALEAKGLVTRIPSEIDRRSSEIRLTRPALIAMRDWLSEFRMRHTAPGDQTDWQ